MRAILPLTIVVLATAVAAAAESANLIRNPSFEAVGHDGLPADWTASSPDATLRPVFQCTEGCVPVGQACGVHSLARELPLRLPVSGRAGFGGKNLRSRGPLPL